MKIDVNISPKASSALALMLAIAAISTPITGFAQDAHNNDCSYKKLTQAPISAPEPNNSTVTPNTAVSTTELAAAPVIPQPSSTDMKAAVYSAPVSSELEHLAPHLLTDTGEAGQLLDKQTKIVQVETVATSAKLDIQSTMKTKTKPDAPDLWRNILVNHTNKDAYGLVRFDYAGLKAAPNDMATLTNYIDELAIQKPSTFKRNEAMVYWANLYNALTVRIVAENYPVTSIRKIKSGFLPGPWKKKLVTVEGKTFSLDNIEHDIMRPTFETPLIHYMVNCASVGCPNLKETPWQAATLEADLETAARSFINSPQGVSTDSGKLKVSSIYKWYQKDFGGNEQGVLEHLSQYANEDVAAKLLGRKNIDKFDYDWGINAP